uniref:Uncharacterized protein n=1 Tax=Macaca mulatta TaxID=9544 RepID=A0A5F8AKC7_MACMU
MSSLPMLLCLMHLTLLTAAPSNPYVWRFWLYENKTHPGETPQAGKLLASADCPPSGCNTIVYLNFTRFQIAQPATPMICFEYDQTEYNCKNYWWHQSAGCPYSYCKTHSVRYWRERQGWYFYKTESPVTYTWIIRDPWDSRWTTPQHGGVYYSSTSTWPSSHLYLWRSLVQIQPLIHTQIHRQETKLSQDLQPFSWLTLLREGLAFANLTGLGDLSSCFMCATLGRPPLTAVPLSSPPTNYTGFNSSIVTIPDVALYRDPYQEKYPYCYSAFSNSLCNQSATYPNSPIYAPPGVFFWCNMTLLKTLSKSISDGQLCIPVTLVPRLTLLTPAEFIGWAGTAPTKTARHRRAVFLPLIAGISLTTSVVAAGLAGGALQHSMIENDKLLQQFSVAMEDSAYSLASLQRQLTSLAQVTLQNRRALDLLTAEKGGTCMFLKEECCFYINESGLVEERVQRLHELSLEMKKQQFTTAANNWWSSSMFSLLAPLLGPLMSLLLLFTIGPCVVNKILQFVRERFDTIQLMVLRSHHQPLLHPESEAIL